MAEQKVTTTISDRKKSSKPIMEKRRRARINASLTELKSLLLDVIKQEGTRHSKMEKADILEMAVRHLKDVQRSCQEGTPNMSIPSSKYSMGFQACVSEVIKYFNTDRMEDLSLKTKLLSHLNDCMSEECSSSTNPTNSTSTPPGDIKLSHRLIRDFDATTSSSLLSNFGNSEVKSMPSVSQSISLSTINNMDDRQTMCDQNHNLVSSTTKPPNVEITQSPATSSLELTDALDGNIATTELNHHAVNSESSRVRLNDVQNPSGILSPELGISNSVTSSCNLILSHTNPKPEDTTVQTNASYVNADANNNVNDIVIGKLLGSNQNKSGQNAPAILSNIQQLYNTIPLSFPIANQQQPAVVYQQLHQIPLSVPQTSQFPTFMSPHGVTNQTTIGSNLQISPFVKGSQNLTSTNGSPGTQSQPQGTINLKLMSTLNNNNEIAFVLPADMFSTGGTIPKIIIPIIPQAPQTQIDSASHTQQDLLLTNQQPEMLSSEVAHIHLRQSDNNVTRHGNITPVTESIISRTEQDQCSVLKQSAMPLTGILQPDEKCVGDGTVMERSISSTNNSNNGSRISTITGESNDSTSVNVVKDEQTSWSLRETSSFKSQHIDIMPDVDSRLLSPFSQQYQGTSKLNHHAPKLVEDGDGSLLTHLATQASQNSSPLPAVMNQISNVENSPLFHSAVTHFNFSDQKVIPKHHTTDPCLVSISTKHHKRSEQTPPLSLGKHIELPTENTMVQACVITDENSNVLDLSLSGRNGQKRKFSTHPSVTIGNDYNDSGRHGDGCEGDKDNVIATLPKRQRFENCVTALNSSDTDMIKSAGQIDKQSIFRPW